MSRDLAEFGVLKVGNRYLALPHEPGAAGIEVLPSFVLGITPAQNLVVVYTRDGTAGAVANVLDRVKGLKIVGTIAGRIRSSPSRPTTRPPKRSRVSSPTSAGPGPAPPATSSSCLPEQRRRPTGYGHTSRGISGSFGRCCTRRPTGSRETAAAEGRVLVGRPKLGVTWRVGDDRATLPSWPWISPAVAGWGPSGIVL